MGRTLMPGGTWRTDGMMDGSVGGADTYGWKLVPEIGILVKLLRTASHASQRRSSYSRGQYLTF